ncbi:MAG: hypothetical protein GXP48_07925 [Acidobacteria bacterium]|nr:hypothetical protein [Acidobacteriota bacterium]
MLQDDAVTVNVAIPVHVTVRVGREAAARQVVHRVAGSAAHVLTREASRSDLTAAVAFYFFPQGGIRVDALEQAPVGSGLGGSSAYAVALARALLEMRGETMSEPRLVATLRDLEAGVLAAPAGTQDYWAALRGGALAVHIRPGVDEVEPLPVDTGWLAERLTVFFTGLVHHSGRVNWQIYRRRVEGDVRTVSALAAIGRAARRCREALLAGDHLAVGDAIAAEWEARTRLAPDVSPPELARIIDAAREAGASAVKAGGAGGGGSLVVWHDPGLRERIVAALEHAAPGGNLLTSGMTSVGCRVSQTV